MVDFNVETSQLLQKMRAGINGPDGEALQFLQGIFSRQEIPDVNRRFRVKEVLEASLASDNAVSFRAVARECTCSEELVGRVWRAIRDQYPASPAPADAFCVAVPKEARAHLLVENILLESGFRIDPAAKALVDLKKEMAPIAYREMRGREIPVYLKAGRVQCGFLGNDKIVEVQSEARENGNEPVELDIRGAFYVNAFRMCVAVPKEQTAIQTLQDLQGKVIATSYASTLKQFLASKNIAAREVKYLSGGVEEACRDLGADAIMDIVETGDSLRRNNLVQLGAPIYRGNMSLISLPAAERPVADTLMARFTRRLDAVQALEAA